MMKGMYRMVTGVDDAIGRLRERLMQLGLHKNTIILFTSDNGSPGGRKGGITSILNGRKIEGGKSKTTDAGTTRRSKVNCSARKG